MANNVKSCGVLALVRIWLLYFHLLFSHHYICPLHPVFSSCYLANTIFPTPCGRNLNISNTERHRRAKKDGPGQAKHSYSTSGLESSPRLHHLEARSGSLSRLILCQYCRTHSSRLRNCVWLGVSTVCELRVRANDWPRTPSQCLQILYIPYITCRHQLVR
jgi:hypothetical protein